MDNISSLRIHTGKHAHFHSNYLGGEQRDRETWSQVTLAFLVMFLNFLIKNFVLCAIKTSLNLKKYIYKTQGFDDLLFVADCFIQGPLGDFSFTSSLGCTL